MRSSSTVESALPFLFEFSFQLILRGAVQLLLTKRPHYILHLSVGSSNLSAEILLIFFILSLMYIVHLLIISCCILSCHHLQYTLVRPSHEQTAQNSVVSNWQVGTVTHTDVLGIGPRLHLRLEPAETFKTKYHWKGADKVGKKKKSWR